MITLVLTLVLAQRRPAPVEDLPPPAAAAAAIEAEVEQPAAPVTPPSSELLPPAEPAPGDPFPSTSTSAEIYRARCAMCHGRTGAGNSKLGRTLGARDITSPQWQQSRTDEQIRAAITGGIAGSRMRRFAALGTVTQLDGLVALVRSMRSGKP